MGDTFQTDIGDTHGLGFGEKKEKRGGSKGGGLAPSLSWIEQRGGRGGGQPPRLGRLGRGGVSVGGHPTACASCHLHRSEAGLVARMQLAEQVWPKVDLNDAGGDGL